MATSNLPCVEYVSTANIGAGDYGRKGVSPAYGKYGSALLHPCVLTITYVVGRATKNLLG